MVLHSGIYQIKNVVTDECYVGSTKNFNSRKAQHFFELRRGKHRTTRLQEAYYRYGPKSLVFSILEYVQATKEHLLEREQLWIDRLHPEYNEILDVTEHIPNSARTKEAKEKISEAIKKLWENPEYRERCSIPRNWKDGIPNRRGAVLSEETKQKLRDANTGANNPNYGKPRGQSFLDKMQKTYPGVISPDGVVFSPITGLKAFCNQHGLDSGQLSRVLSGKAKSHKGWTRV